MRAVDANVLVRFLTGDDQRQYQAARRLMEVGEVFIATTVMLETEWVLRSSYGLTPATIHRLLREIAGLSGVRVQDPRVLDQALTAMDAGADFADALHVGQAEDCEAFVTFDRELVKRARGLWPMPVVSP